MVPLFDFPLPIPEAPQTPNTNFLLNYHCLAFWSRPQEDLQVEAEWVSCVGWLYGLVETDGTSRALLGLTALGMEKSQEPGSRARQPSQGRKFPWLSG